MVSFLKLFPWVFHNDSTRIIYTRLNASAAGSAVNAANWNGSSYSSISFLANCDYYRSVHSDSGSGYIVFKTELGLSRFKDSIWQKQSDQFRLQYFFQNTRSKIQRSWIFSLNSQLFESYNYFPEPLSGKLVKEWSGSFFNPAALDVGYGMMISFWENSFINFSIADIKIHTEPKISSRPIESDRHIAKLKRANVVVEYGGSAQWYLFRKLNPYIELQNNGSLFINGVGSDMVNMDWNNKIVSKIWKCVQLRLDSKISYNPFYSHRLQIRNEILLGVFYDVTK